jgi:hypothetical protein
MVLNGRDVKHVSQGLSRLAGLRVNDMIQRHWKKRDREEDDEHRYRFVMAGSPAQAL